MGPRSRWLPERHQYLSSRIRSRILQTLQEFRPRMRLFVRRLSSQELFGQDMGLFQIRDHLQFGGIHPFERTGCSMGRLVLEDWHGT